MSDELLLSVKNLATNYGGFRALRGVSFDLKPGHSLGVVGESGSGKSVMLRSIIGVHPRGSSPVVDGSVHFKGEDFHALGDSERRKKIGTEIGMIHQDPLKSLHPLKKIWQSVAEVFTVRDTKKSTQELRSDVAAMLEAVGLHDVEDLMDRYPHQMSGGQRQRVGIAAALIARPDLIIADEPTTALDVTVQAKVLDLLGSLREENNSSMILVTHDLAIVAERCDHIMVLYRGRVAEMASSRRLLTNPTHPYTRGLLGSRPHISGPKPHRLTVMPHVEPPTHEPIKGGDEFGRARGLDISIAEQTPPGLYNISDDPNDPHWVAPHAINHSPDPSPAVAQKRQEAKQGSTKSTEGQMYAGA